MSHDASKPMDALQQEQRIIGESRMIRDIASVTRENSKAVFEAVHAFRQSRNLHANYIAKAIGVSPSTLSEVLRSLYEGDWKQIVFDLDRWLEEEHKRDAAPRPTEYVETRVAMDIMTVANATTTLRGIGLVFGPSGVGKSIALAAVAAEKPGSVLISVETMAATAPGLVDALAKALRVSTNARRSSMRHTLEAVKEKLSKSGRLIMIDEVHKLCGAGANDEKSLNVLRDLHDHTGVPILLCGTVDLVSYLERRQAGGREPLGQIRSRIVISRDLMDRTLDEGGGGSGGEPLFSVEEVRKVFAKSKMRLATDAARYLQMLANVPDSGGLRTCRNLVIMATKVNQSKAEVLTAEMLRGAQKLLVNRRAFTLLEARMAELQPARGLAKVG